MPAHTSAKNATSLQRASGRKVSIVDWRANNLADHLARMAAEENAPPKSTVRLVKDAFDMVKCAAAKLGLVTWAANNHEVTELQADGTTKKVIKRDACEPPAVKRAPRNTSAHNSEPACDPVDITLTGPKPKSAPARHRMVTSRAASKRAAIAREKRRQDDAFAEAVTSIAGCAPPQAMYNEARQKQPRSTSIATASVASRNSASNTSSNAPCHIPAACPEQPLQQQQQQQQLLRRQPLTPAVTHADSGMDVDSCVVCDCSTSLPTAQPAAATPQNSNVQELFAGNGLGGPGTPTASSALGGVPGELLELALLERDGLAVCWPPGASLPLLLQVRAAARMMAT